VSIDVLKKSVGGCLKTELTEYTLNLYKDIFNNNIELQNHINFLKIFKTDNYINDNLRDDPICFKISLIRKVEKLLKLDFMDVTFNSCQLNVSLNGNLFDSIKSTFQTKNNCHKVLRISNICM
jgi:hypothetical protein